MLRGTRYTSLSSPATALQPLVACLSAAALHRADDVAAVGAFAAAESARVPGGWHHSPCQLAESLRLSAGRQQQPAQPWWRGADGGPGASVSDALLPRAC